MDEVIIRLDEKQWDLMRTGRKSVVIFKSVPEKLFLPFRAYVCVDGSGFVGSFYCDGWRKTLDTPSLAFRSGYTKSQLIEKAAKMPLCGWHVMDDSVIEYNPPLEVTFDGKPFEPPQEWARI